MFPCELFRAMICIVNVKACVLCLCCACLVHVNGAVHGHAVCWYCCRMTGRGRAVSRQRAGLRTQLRQALRRRATPRERPPADPGEEGGHASSYWPHLRLRRCGRSAGSRRPGRRPLGCCSRAWGADRTCPRAAWAVVGIGVVWISRGAGRPASVRPRDCGHACGWSRRVVRAAEERQRQRQSTRPGDAGGGSRSAGCASEGSTGCASGRCSCATSRLQHLRAKKKKAKRGRRAGQVAPSPMRCRTKTALLASLPQAREDGAGARGARGDCGRHRQLGDGPR